MSELFRCYSEPLRRVLLNEKTMEASNEQAYNITASSKRQVHKLKGEIRN